MSTLPLFDLALAESRPSASVKSSPDATARVVRLAGRLVDSALSSIESIRELDLSLAPPSNDPALFDRRVAILLRGMYEEWARDAGALLDRITRLCRDGTTIRGADRLRDEHGRTLAMLQVTLESAERAGEQIRRGQTHAIEDVRNELRAAARP